MALTKLALALSLAVPVRAGTAADVEVQPGCDLESAALDGDGLQLLQMSAQMRSQGLTTADSLSSSLAGVVDYCDIYTVKLQSATYKDDEDATVYSYEVSCGPDKDISHWDLSKTWGEQDLSGLKIRADLSSNDKWVVGKDGKHTWPSGDLIWGIKSDNGLGCPGSRTYTVALDGKMETCAGRYVVKAGRNFAFCNAEVPCTQAMCDTDGACTIAGDPHITVFDQSLTAALVATNASMATGEAIDNYGVGDFWLVRSANVSIQGRYRKVVYPNAKHPQRTFLTAVAVSGPFLEGHTLIIAPQERDITWYSPKEKAQHILRSLPSDFSFKSLVSARYHKGEALVPPTPGSSKADVADFELPSDVKVRVDRFKQHLDMRITMPKPGPQEGLDGQCGNFNGDALDDTSALIGARSALKISDNELLFDD